MNIQYAPLTLAWALMAAVSAQAAPLTFSFSGTLDYVGGGSQQQIAEGDSFTGSFSVESSALDINPVAFIGNYTESFSIEATVNGFVYSSSTTASDCPACGGVEVFIPSDGTTHSFGAYSGLLGYPPVSGPNLSGYAPFQMSINLYDASKSVFSSDALPSNLVLSSFSSRRFNLFFQQVDGIDNRYVTGVITSLTLVTAAPIPEVSTGTMLAIGLGVAGIAARRRKNR